MAEIRSPTDGQSGIEPSGVDQSGIESSAGQPGGHVFAPTIEATWGKEARALLFLGAPMALTQIVQFSINAIDVLMIGRLGPEEIAASSLGLLFFFTAFIVGYGPAMAVSPMISQAIGAGTREANNDASSEVRRSVRMGLWSLLALWPAVIVLFAFAPSIATALGQPEELSVMAGPYVLALAPSWLFAEGILVLRNFLAAIERTRFPLLVIIGTTFLNAFLNWLLIFGALGAPELGLLGAGIASSIANGVGFAVLAWYCMSDQRAKPYAVLSKFNAPDWPRLQEVGRLGWPIAVTTAFEGFLFNACILVMGRIGVDEMAAYQVALNVAAMAFMGAFGFAMAGSVRVGLHQGAGDRAGVRIASALSIVYATAVITCFAVPVFLFPEFISELYLDRSDPGNAAVLVIIVSFLRIAALFMLFDAVQVAANQALRGVKDVTAPMIITGVSYWVVGFPIAVFLGLFSPVGAPGVWIGFLISLGLAAVLLGARLYWKTR